MKIAVLFFGGKKTKVVSTVAAAFRDGLITQSACQVGLIDGDQGTGESLAPYQYIVIIATAYNLWGGNVSPKISRFLRSSGQITGKRCSAFVVAGGIRSNKTLQALMKTMEQEGMYLKLSDKIKTCDEAKTIGAKLHVTR